MRVLHVAESVPGGIASYFEEIAPYQNRKFGPGTVRFLVPAGSRDHLPSIPAEQIVEFSPAGRSRRGLLALATFLHREIRSFDPDILHLHSTFAGAIARPVARFSGRKPKIVYCPHGWVFGMELPAWKRKLYALIERSLVPLTDAIVNISHADHQLARVNGISSRKMVTIRNGISTIPPETGSGETGFRSDRINLIFVGRHDRQKGLDILLRLFSSVPLDGVHLHVVGAPVLDGRMGEVTRDLPSNVTFYGWKTRESVSAMIARADALIVPSRWEGFGLVAVEAMRLGKPVIASRCGGLAEIVEHGKTGLLFGLGEQAGLRAMLEHLDRDQLREMGVAARARFLSNFTAERLNAELASLYARLESRRPRPRFHVLPANAAHASGIPPETLFR